MNSLYVEQFIATVCELNSIKVEQFIATVYELNSFYVKQFIASVCELNSLYVKQFTATVCELNSLIRRTVPKLTSRLLAFIYCVAVSYPIKMSNNFAKTSQTVTAN